MSNGLTIIVLGLLAMTLGVVTAMVFLRSRGRRRTSPSCGGCGYDVCETLGRSPICPECGANLGAVGVVPPGQERWRRLSAMWPAVCVLAIFATVGLTLSMAAGARRAAALQMQVALAAQAQAQAQAQTPQQAALQSAIAALNAEIAELRKRLAEAQRGAAAPPTSP